jgi:hypothetical protein
MYSARTKQFGFQRLDLVVSTPFPTSFLSLTRLTRSYVIIASQMCVI